ncbi:MAG: TIGR03960 family B12-binding radical SAM protein [Endomicrobium sp.]|jgi:radical SAM family uncharacterized protein/radical SAM-linked protein|nr:TIGR03960 family B12-binding radical SAM protein [Endomicrobium sp.]
MKNPQVEEILRLVQRPSRYINGELNSYSADLSADFSICLCFPDVYEVGASNLGLEILYHLINEKKLARCERAYSPDGDLEKLLRERKLALFSLESNCALKSFDIVGFTIQCELVAANIVNMLDLSQIPIFAKDRGDGCPLIVGGGPALTNPEPFCDFFDLFVLGDGEQALPEIIETCKRLKGEPRKKRLKELSKINGVYVPSLYAVEYNEDNTVKSVSPIEPDVKPTIDKSCLQLKDVYFPKKKIVPFVETVHNRLNIEVARGCPGQCRFCQASKYYRPWRQRTLEQLLEFLKDGIDATGYEEVAFSSLSCSDYKHLDKLLIAANELYGDTKLNISLPSLRCSEHSLKVARYINRSKKPTLTFAPEAGTDALRNVIGKYLSEKQIIDTLLSANAMGWKVIKLYFMIGLPTETDEDIAGITELVKKVRKAAKGLNFNATVSPFVPKAQTAFQWFSMAKSEEIARKIDLLNKLLPAVVKAHNHKASVLEAFIAKGDRRLSQAIYKAWQKGARFDQWADKFNENIWNEAIVESGLSLDFYAYRTIKEDEVLPWEHLNFGVSKETLYKDYLKGLSERENGKSNAESGDVKCQNSNEAQSVLPIADFPPLISKSDIFPVSRFLLRFSRLGLVKFISHLEQIEVFRRAARRSGLPIAFTAGFSPQVKCSFGPPVSVGNESLCEYMELYFTQNIDAQTIMDKISAVLPSNFKILSAKRRPLKFPAIDILVNAVEYEIENADINEKEIEEFLSQETIFVEKIKKNKSVIIDVKPLIKTMSVKNAKMKLILRFGEGKNVKPELLLENLLKNKGNYAKIYIIKRANLYIETSSGDIYEP